MNLKTLTSNKIVIFLAFAIIILGCAAGYRKFTIVKFRVSEELCADCALQIPKIIHRIWIPFSPERKNPPEEYQLLDKILKELHPDWKFMEWREDDLEKFIKQHYPKHYDTFMSYDQKVKKHDAARYFLLHHYGGVFIQHSLSFFKNIEPLLQGYNMVFSQDEIGRASIYNGWIASIPNHKFYSILINNLDNTKNLASPLRATGPGFVTRNLKKYIKNNDISDIQILSNKFLLPFNWKEKKSEPIYSSCISNSAGRYERCKKLFKDAYAYTLWKSEWRPLQKKRKRT